MSLASGVLVYLGEPATPALPSTSVCCQETRFLGSEYQRNAAAGGALSRAPLAFPRLLDRFGGVLHYEN